MTTLLLTKRPWLTFACALLFISCAAPPAPQAKQSPSISSLRLTQRFSDVREQDTNLHGVSLGLTGIYAIDQTSVFLFGSLNTTIPFLHRSLILSTTDGGQTWQETQLKSNEGQSFYHMAFVEDGIGWALAAYNVEDFSFGFLYRTSDYGKTWSEPIEIGEWGFHVSGMRFFDKDNGEIIFNKYTASPSDRAGVITTTDGGQTWTQTKSISAQVNGAINKFLDGIAWPAGGNYGSYWRNYSEDNTAPAVGQDDSEWHFYYYKPAKQYIVLWRENSKSAWQVASTLYENYDYKDGVVSVAGSTR